MSDDRTRVVLECALSFLAMQGIDCQERVRIVEEIANAQRESRSSRRVDAAAITKACSVARADLERRAGVLRASLEQRVSAYDRIGTVPSLFRAMGLSDQELPYNKAIAWLLDPSEGHCAGRVALSAIAEGLGFAGLVEELQDPACAVEVRGEQAWPDDAGSPRAPDLLVLTPTSVLLIENKVLSPESGTGQYAEYLEALIRLSSGRGTAWQAWLAAPEKRRTPDGWTGSFSHSQLSNWLTTAASGTAVSQWGRIACLLVAEEILRGRARDRDRALRHARATLRTKSTDQVLQVGELSSALNMLPPPLSPFGGDHGTEVE